MENRIKHLEMIENIIERMGSNSFQLKGWAVALVSIVGALAAKETDRKFFLLAFIPLVAFWFIDSYYLQSERKYKHLYKIVLKKDESKIDFSMDTDSIVVKGTRMQYRKCLLSRTEMGFYGSVIIAVIILAILLKVF